MVQLRIGQHCEMVVSTSQLHDLGEDNMLKKAYVGIIVEDGEK